MRILIIGGNGTIGKRLTTALKKEHEVLIGGRSSGDVLVNINEKNSII